MGSLGKKIWLALSAAILCASSLTPTANAAGLLTPVGGQQSLAIESQKVDVRINNGVAVTTVTQIFRNSAAQPLEALYTFPVPREASVSNFSMWINGKEVIGEVLERQQARQIYQQVTRVERKDPGLLEQVDHKTFEMRVFPVPARGTQQVQITYYQPVDYDSGFGTYVYPLEMDEAASRLSGELSLMVDVKSEIPLKRTWSPSHGDALVTAEMGPGRYRAGIEQAQGNLDRDFVLVYELERERMGLNLVTSRAAGDDGYFLLLVTPGAAYDEPRKQVNVTYVLDVSGSMNTAGKLDVARQAALEGIKAMREGDTFNVIAFNIAPTSLAPQPLAVNDENRQRALDFLQSLEGRGGTDIVPALEQAMTMQVPQARNAVLLLSDGQATDVNEHSAFLAAVRRSSAGTRIFSFGIGNEINRPLLDRLAVETGGLADYLSGQDEIQRKIGLMQKKLASPVAEKLRLTIDGVEISDVCPQQVPNLYRGQQLALFGRYRGAGEAKLTLTGDILGKRETLTAKLDFPQTDADNPEIERMWAWRKVDGLLSQVREQGETAALKQQVVSLGTKYSIVTPYTAFLVLENEAAYQRFGIERRNLERVDNERSAAERQRTAGPAASTARDVTWSGSGGGGSSGGGAVEWLFLAGAGLMVGGRLVNRRRSRE
ncbi:MAG TPA: VIT domain-containing protein [Pirellulales bacterium]|jgi:Ca-activated chloride channel family protein|nr:VIT domain-containing protein [Pirellulales bacterium]